MVGSYALQFSLSQTSLLSWAGQPSSAVVNTVLPPIVVEVVDSTGELDTAANGITIVVSASKGLLSPDGTVEAVVNGVATFPSLPS